jgi:VAD1 Analog of StAR-related lipid transfer domain
MYREQVISLFRSHFDKFFALRGVRNSELHTIDIVQSTDIQVYAASESESWGLLHLGLVTCDFCKTAIMAPKVLKEFVLQCSIDTFVKSFWLDINWYERFLSEKLLDISINVGDWTLSSEKPFTAYIRNVKSYHPSKISFPGLPSHAEVRDSLISCTVETDSLVVSSYSKYLPPIFSSSSYSQSHKKQTYNITQNGNSVTLSIKETNSFRGIPYADYFTVNTEWIVVSSNQETRECTVKILLDFEFMKSTWLQGTIESNTRAELLTVYELWYGTAEEYLLSENIPDIVISNLNPFTPFLAISPRGGHHGTKDLESGNFEEMTADCGCRPTNTRGSLSVVTAPASRSKDTEDSRSNCGSDDEMQFFDCEDERVWTDDKDDDEYHRDTFSERELLLSPATRSRKASTPEKLRLQYSQSAQSTGGEASSVKDLAVTVVETAFVLAEFSFWKVGFHSLVYHAVRGPNGHLPVIPARIPDKGRVSNMFTSTATSEQPMLTIGSK